MNKIRMPIAALLFMAVVVSLSLAFGGSEGPRGAWEGPCGNPEVMRNLNLMPDQVTRIEELRVLFLNDVKPIRDKLFAKRGDLRLLWLEKRVSRARQGGARPLVATGASRAGTPLRSTLHYRARGGRPANRSLRRPPPCGSPSLRGGRPARRQADWT